MQQEAGGLHAACPPACGSIYMQSCEPGWAKQAVGRDRLLAGALAAALAVRLGLTTPSG